MFNEDEKITSDSVLCTNYMLQIYCH